MAQENIKLSKKFKKKVKKFAKLNAKVWKKRSSLENEIKEILISHYGEEIPTSIEDVIFDLMETQLIHENNSKKYIKEFQKLLK